jgi:septal ring factor EnvC (AmiA/AmiB activator)
MMCRCFKEGEMVRRKLIGNSKGMATFPIVLIAEGIILLVLTFAVFIPHFKQDEKLKSALEEKVRMLDEKEKEVENLNAQLSKITNENTNLNKKISSLSNEVKDKNREIEILRNEVEKLEKEKNELVKLHGEKVSKEKQIGEKEKKADSVKKSQVAKKNDTSKLGGGKGTKKTTPQKPKPIWKSPYKGGKG